MVVFVIDKLEPLPTTVRPRLVVFPHRVPRARPRAPLDVAIDAAPAARVGPRVLERLHARRVGVDGLWHHRDGGGGGHQQHRREDGRSQTNRRHRRWASRKGVEGGGGREGQNRCGRGRGAPPWAPAERAPAGAAPAGGQHGTAQRGQAATAARSTRRRPRRGHPRTMIYPRRDADAARTRRQGKPGPATRCRHPINRGKGESGRGGRDGHAAETRQRSTRGTPLHPAQRPLGGGEQLCGRARSGRRASWATDMNGQPPVATVGRPPGVAAPRPRLPLAVWPIRPPAPACQTPSLPHAPTVPALPASCRPAPWAAGRRTGAVPCGRRTNRDARQGAAPCAVIRASGRSQRGQDAQRKEERGGGDARVPCAARGRRHSSPPPPRPCPLMPLDAGPRARPPYAARSTAPVAADGMAGARGAVCNGSHAGATSSAGRRRRPHGVSGRAAGWVGGGWPWLTPLPLPSPAALPPFPSRPRQGAALQAGGCAGDGGGGGSGLTPPLRPPTVGR